MSKSLIVDMSRNGMQFQGKKIEDALAYLSAVESEFCNQPHVYKYFLGIMKTFHKGSLDMPGMIARITTLFHGHPELLAGFNNFLPSGHRIEVHRVDDVTAVMSALGPGKAGSGFKTTVAMRAPRNDDVSHDDVPQTDLVFDLEMSPSS